MKIIRILRFIILPAFSIMFSAANAIAQQDVKDISMERINQMKLEGLLNGTEHFINHSAKQNDLRISSSDARAASTACNCWLQRDTSWQIGQFDASGVSGGPGMPPDYRNDDWSTDTITLPFNFCFYGSPVTKVFLNNNGNVSIGAPYSTYTSNSFPDPNFVMIAPFWADVDTRALGSGLVYYKLTSTYLAVQWDQVGYFSVQDDMLNIFQLIMSDGLDSILPVGQNVSFCYQDMQWTTGSASGGINGFGGTPATVGVNKGTATDFIQIGRYDTAGIAYDGPFGNPDGVSSLDNQSFYLNVCFSGNNVPPIINALQICDTLLVCERDTLLISANYLSPEQGQTTVSSLNTNGITGVSLVSATSGNIANIVVQVIGQASNFGINTIFISGTDNGTPVQTTNTAVHFMVIPSAISGFIFSPASPVQVGTAVTFTNTSTGAIGYAWDFGDGSVTSTVVDPVHVFNIPGLHTVTLIATSANGCEDIYQLQIQVIGCIAVNILAAGIACQGIPVQIGYAGSASSLASFNWNFGGGTIVSGSGIGPYMIRWNTAGNFAIDLTVTDTGGCLTSATAVPVIVNANPVASLSSYSAVCEGDADSVIFTGTAIAGAQFNWNFSNAIIHSGSGPGPYVIYWNNAGNDTIHLTVTQNGCTAVSTYPVLIHPVPTSLFSVPPSVCVQHPVTIAYTGSAPSSASYAWNFDGGNVLSGSGQGPYSVSWDSSRAPDVTLTVIQNGCISPVTNHSLIVSALPAADAGTSMIVCAGDLLQIGTPQQSGLIYQWNPVSGLSNPNAATTFVLTANTLNNLQVNDYVVVVTNMYGCVNSDTVTVTIKPTPVVSFAGSSPQCYNGNSFQFSAIGNLAAGIQYNWMFGNEAIPGSASQQNPPPVRFTATGSHVVTLNATLNGCPAVPFSNQVTVYVSPVVNFLPSLYDGCVPLGVYFNNYSSGDGNMYTWNFSDHPSDTNASPEHVFLNAGVYTIALIATTRNGCVEDTFITDLITVHPLPAAAFEPSPPVTSVWDALISFNNTTDGAVQYQWNFGDGSGSGLKYPSHIYRDTGTFEITLFVTSQFGCRDTVRGLVKIEHDFTFFVPNAFTPNGDGVNDFFKGYGTFLKTYEMKIFNRWGAVIYSTNDYEKPWDGKVGDVVQDDVYIYRIRVSDPKDIIHDYIGRVTLVR